MTEIDLQRILHPTDFSDSSRRAFGYALALAAGHGAVLTALHVVAGTMVPANEGAFLADPTLFDRTAREAILSELGAVVAPARRLGVRAETLVREGDPAAEIAAAARELPADLVVMGTHGRSGVSRWVLGSVAETVLRRVPCPVLTVPAHAPAQADPVPFSRILCPSDFSPSSITALRYGEALADRSGASLMLVHVLDRENLRRMERRWPAGLRSRDYEATALLMLDGLRGDGRPRHAPTEEFVTWGKPAAEILKVAREHHADLIVMGGHGRSLLGLMAFGSVTHEVVRGAACPVLTLRSFPRATLAVPAAEGA